MTESRSVTAWGDGWGFLGRWLRSWRKIWGNDGYFHYFDCSDGFMNVYVCQNLSKFPFNYVFKYITVNMFNLSYVNYISMKLLKISTAIDELCTGKACLPTRESQAWTLRVLHRRLRQPARQMGGKQAVPQSQSVSRRRGHGPSCHTPPAEKQSQAWPWQIRKQ